MVRGARLGLGLLLVCSAACRTELENTASPPGDLTSYAPFELAPEVGKFAGKGAKLIAMEANGVPPSGRMVLRPSFTEGYATYNFYVEADDATVRVVVMKPYDTTKSGTRQWESSPKRHLGMKREPSPLNALSRPSTVASVIPWPTCSAGALWKAAIAAGAPAKGEADITYGADGYELRLRTPERKTWRLGSDCKVVGK